jgi:hypothetical protein
MPRALKLSDFRWILINEEKNDGYYSFKEGEWELALDWTYDRGWTVYLCNKFEEVLEEYGCEDKKRALKIINIIYKSF